MKPTSIRLSDDVFEKLKAEADHDKRSISKQIEYIIQQYYEMKRLLNK